MTVTIAPALLCDIEAAAARCDPDEACGLLVGRKQGASHTVTEVHVSRNIAAEPRHRFEVDPGLRLRLQRQARERCERVIGVFHSHPGGEPAPSETDRASIWEPDLIWLITGVHDGVAGQTKAFMADPAGTGFRPLEMLVV